MTFEFTRRGGIEAQVRDIARAQIGKALEECSQDGSSFDAVVHGLRRRCKKLRGLMRLIEPRFKPFKLENRGFRDAANGLAGMRDAAVLVETFAALLAFDGQRKGGARLDAAQAETLAAWLQTRTGVAPTGDDKARLLGHFVSLFEAAGERAKDWSVAGQGFDQIGDGLEATYRRMRDGLAAADATQTPEALHDWRKDTKYHWHHVSLLQRTAPDVLRPRRTSLNRLGELLGDHHNLAVLADTLAEHDDIAAVSEVIAERQALLASEALQLGRQLVAEKPSMLRDRFEQYWSLLPEKS